MEGGLAAGINLGHVGQGGLILMSTLIVRGFYQLTEIFSGIEIVIGRDFVLMHVWELIEGCL